MAQVKTGLQRLLTEEFDGLKGKKVGLCCNPTTVDHRFRHAIDLLSEAPHIELTALFGPEHGIRSDVQYMVGVGDVSRDARSGLPVYSLYGHDEASLRPTPAMLEGLDVLMFDIQDVGSRYYTYIYTMSYLMEAAKDADLEVWVLDRPNPIAGHLVEGPMIDEGYTSFVGKYSIPNRHGMTAGELALYFNDVCGIGCRLKVIEMSGWKREQWFEQSGLPWVMPSPNMPTLDTALVYPGGCLYEGTNISEGRGTTRPFELVGAPYLDAFELVEKISKYDLPGVAFRTQHMVPTFDKWTGQSCAGLQFHVTDRETFLPFLTGVALILTCHQLAPHDFAWRTEAYEFVSDRLAIDLLFGGPQIRAAIEQHAPLDEIAQLWAQPQRDFLEARKPYLLYPHS